MIRLGSRQSKDYSEQVAFKGRVHNHCKYYKYEEALQSLADDHELLLKGGVFTQDVIDNWINYKTENDVDPVRLRPHPYEFHLII